LAGGKENQAARRWGGGGNYSNRKEKVLFYKSEKGGSGWNSNQKRGGTPISGGKSFRCFPAKKGSKTCTQEKGCFDERGGGWNINLKRKTFQSGQRKNEARLAREKKRKNRVPQKKKGTGHEPQVGENYLNQMGKKVWSSSGGGEDTIKTKKGPLNDCGEILLTTKKLQVRGERRSSWIQAAHRGGRICQNQDRARWQRTKRRDRHRAQHWPRKIGRQRPKNAINGRGEWVQARRDGGGGETSSAKQMIAESSLKRGEKKSSAKKKNVCLQSEGGGRSMEGRRTNGPCKSLQERGKKPLAPPWQ